MRLAKVLMLSFMCSTGVAWAFASAEPVSVTSFRPGHNLSLLLGIHQSRWEITRVGALSGRSADGWYPSAEARYSFHFSLLKKTGYFVGWGLRYIHDEGNYAGLMPDRAVSFPSILLGLVQNTTSNTRVLLGAVYEAVWYRWMSAQKENARSVRVGPVLDSAALWGGFDFFWTDRQALSLAAGYRRTWNWSLKSRVEENSSLLLDNLELENRGFYFQVGMTWQLADELER